MSVTCFLYFYPPLQLSLRDNDLISLPKDIGDLGQLKELHIQGNRLTVLPPELGTDPHAHMHTHIHTLSSITITQSPFKRSSVEIQNIHLTSIET